jgi:hypothetical protein
MILRWPIHCAYVVFTAKRRRSRSAEPPENHDNLVERQSGFYMPILL